MISSRECGHIFGILFCTCTWGNMPLEWAQFFWKMPRREKCFCMSDFSSVHDTKLRSSFKNILAILVTNCNIVLDSKQPSWLDSHNLGHNLVTLHFGVPFRPLSLEWKELEEDVSWGSQLECKSRLHCIAMAKARARKGRKAFMAFTLRKRRPSHETHYFCIKDSQLSKLPLKETFLEIWGAIQYSPENCPENCPEKCPELSKCSNSYFLNFLTVLFTL